MHVNFYKTHIMLGALISAYMNVVMPAAISEAEAKQQRASEAIEALLTGYYNHVVATQALATTNTPQFQQILTDPAHAKLPHGFLLVGSQGMGKKSVTTALAHIQKRKHVTYSCGLKNLTDKECADAVENVRQHMQEAITTHAPSMITFSDVQSLDEDNASSLGHLLLPKLYTFMDATTTHDIVFAFTAAPGKKIATCPLGF